MNEDENRRAEAVRLALSMTNINMSTNPGGLQAVNADDIVDAAADIDKFLRTGERAESPKWGSGGCEVVKVVGNVEVELLPNSSMTISRGSGNG